MASVQTSLQPVGWISLGSLGQLVVQCGFYVLLARYFGASAEMDAYLAALALPTALSAILVGSLGYVLVPVFRELLRRELDEQAWAMASRLGLIAAGGCGLLVALLMLFARPLATVLFPGFDAGQLDLTTRLLRILAWLVLTNSLTSLFQTIYHGRERFLTPAVAPVVGMALTIGLTVRWQEQGVLGVAWAVVLGGVVTAALQSLPWASHFSLESSDERGVRYCFRALAPLVLGAVCIRLDPLVDRYLASHLPAGSISHLGYAWCIVSALLMVGSSGLSVVAFPHLPRHWAAGEYERFFAEVALALRALAVILVPLCVALVCYSRPLVRDLLERGEFRPSDTLAVAWLLVIYTGAIVATGVGEVVAKVLYALSDTRTPLLVGMFGFILGIGLKVTLAPRAGVGGIVLATSLYSLLSTAALVVILRRRVPGGIGAGVSDSLTRAVIAGGVAAVAAYPFAQSDVRGGAMAGAVVGAAAYLLVLLAFGDEFVRKLLRQVRWLLVISPPRREAGDDQ